MLYLALDMVRCTDKTKRSPGKLLNVKAPTFDDSLLDKTFPELHNEEEDRLRGLHEVCIKIIKCCAHAAAHGWRFLIMILTG